MVLGVVGPASLIIYGGGIIAFVAMIVFYTKVNKYMNRKEK